MTHLRINRQIVMLTAILPVLFVAGCFELDVETAVNEDGSAERRLEMVIPDDSEEDDETGLTIDDFQDLYGFSVENGWSRTKEGTDDEPVHAFRRMSRTDDLAKWAKPWRDIHIKGTVEESPYAHVTFGNSVQVWTEETPGSRSFKYREKFFWDGLGDALIERQIEEFRESLRAEYPKLTPGVMGELIGLLKGGYWSAVEEGMFEMSEGERAVRFRPLAERITEQGVKTLRRDHPDVDEGYLSDMVVKIVIERDERDEDFLEEKVVGAALALLTEVHVRLNLPGRIVDSNAHSQEGSTLIWKLEPGSAIDRPIEIFAESVLTD